MNTYKKEDEDEKERRKSEKKMDEQDNQFLSVKSKHKIYIFIL